MGITELICGTLINTWVVSKIPDIGGYNYLLRGAAQVGCPSDGPVYELDISYTGDIGGVVDGRLLVGVYADCAKIKKYAQATESFGYWYDAYICSATKVK